MTRNKATGAIFTNITRPNIRGLNEKGLHINNKQGGLMINTIDMMYD